MRSMRCLGGVAMQGNNAFLVRPIPGEGEHGWPADLDVQVGEVWEVGLRRSRDIEAPHVEDCVCDFRNHIETLTTERLLALVRRMKPIWRGGIRNVFDHHLRYTRSDAPRAYVAGRGDPSTLPSGSVGFWELPAPLSRHVEERDGRQRSLYAYAGPYSDIFIPYVGESPALDVIPKGTIVRVSLARWWCPEANPMMEERCYLQLSGWYGIESEGRQRDGDGGFVRSDPVTEIDEDDIPF